MKKRCALCLFALLAAAPSSAETITFNFTTVFSGSEPGGVGTPWLTATFTDVDGGVQLTLTAVNLLPSEYISLWGFNLNPDLFVKGFDPTPTPVSGQAGTVNAGSDVKKLDGDGWYDVVFSFPTAETSRFTNGESSIWFFSGLKASDFKYLSTSGGGSTSLYTAAHVQGIDDPVPSGWLTVVPEPLSVFLVGAGLMLSSVALRHKRRHS